MGSIPARGTIKQPRKEPPSGGFFVEQEKELLAPGSWLQWIIYNTDKNRVLL